MPQSGRALRTVNSVTRPLVRATTTPNAPSVTSTPGPWLRTSQRGLRVAVVVGLELTVRLARISERLDATDG